MKKCMNCGKEIEYEPEYCCSGLECGCQGLPMEPPLCKDCWDKILNPEGGKDHEFYKNYHN